MTIEDQATCDDLRNIIFIGRPPSSSDRIDYCDIISEKKERDKKLCIMSCECGPPADQCYFKFHAGTYESTVNICEVSAS